MFYSGVITNVLPGTYSGVVACNDGTYRLCDFGDKAIAALGGVMDCELPQPRTEVLVYATNSKNCNFVSYLTPSSTTRTPLNAAHETSPAGGTGPYGEAAYGAHLAFSGTSTYADNQGDRPIDVLPGDWSKVTADGTMMSLIPYLARIASGEASITVSQFEGLLRHTSRWYQHFNAMGMTQIMDDHGHCTMEFTGSPRRHEVEGKLAPGTPTHGEEIQAPTEDTSYLEPNEEDLMDLSRFQVYVGALSNLFTAFIAAKPTTTGTVDAPSTREGLMHLHVDEGGRLQLKCKQGLRIGKGGVIPYPQRIRDAQDPEGSAPIDPELTDFDPDGKLDDPALRHLGLADRDDYENAKSYEGFDNQPEDFDTPDSVPTDDDFLAKLKSMIDFGADGSVIIRDTWGSEIRMIGGNIITAPAKNLIEQPLGDKIVLAGRDAIILANRSADLVGNTGDVRVKGENTTSIHGNGILLDSTAETTAHGFPEGEVGADALAAAKLSGVIINAPNATLHTVTRNTVTRADREVTHTDNALHYVGNTTTYVDRNMQIISDNVVQQIGSNSFTLAAKNMSFVAERGLNLIRNGNEVPIIQWVGGEDDIYEDFNSNAALESVREQMSDDSEDYLGALSVDGRANIGFYFRSSATLGTEQSLFQGSSTIGLPESWAQYLYRKEIDTPGGTPATAKMELNALNETLPWPGAGQYNSDTFYHQLTSTVNATDGNLSRETQSANPNDVESISFDNYITLRY